MIPCCAIASKPSLFSYGLLTMVLDIFFTLFGSAIVATCVVQSHLKMIEHLLEIFSSHPPLNKRIERLMQST